MTEVNAVALIVTIFEESVELPPYSGCGDFNVNSG
jgi:hypothetical protein